MKPIPIHTQRRLLALVLLYTLAQGVVRLTVAPLWAHYDEATHYEYMRYVVEQRRIPQPGDADPLIFERIAATYSVGSFKPGQQFDEAPGYYILQAFFQTVINLPTLRGQLWLARGVSVLLSVTVALLAYLSVKQLFPRRPLLAIGTPLLMATIFGYVDLMSALNNDVGAVAAFSLLIFAVLVVIRRGLRPANVVLVIVAATLCFFAKTTAWLGIPLAGLGIVLAVWPHLPRPLKLGSAIAPIIALLAALTTAPVAGWSHARQTDPPARISTDAPLGQYAFRVNEDSNKLWQLLSSDTNPAALRGQTVTVGAWIRTPDGAAMAQLPVVWDGYLVAGGADITPGGAVVSTTPEWTFYSDIIDIPAAAHSVTIYLPPVIDRPVEYDGIVIARGAFERSAPPQFSDRRATDGIWAGQPFTNLVDNASAERGWLLLRPQIDRWIPQGGLNVRLQSLYAWRHTWPIYWGAVRWQFVTFWAAFSDGAPGLPVLGLLPLLALSGIAAVGLVRALRVSAKAGQLAGYQWRALEFCAAAIVVMLATSFLRIDPADPAGNIFYIPTARHFYNAIIPTSMLLLIGLGAWLPPHRRAWGLALLVLLIHMLGVWSVLNVQLPWFIATWPIGD